MLFLIVSNSSLFVQVLLDCLDEHVYVFGGRHVLEGQDCALSSLRLVLHPVVTWHEHAIALVQSGFEHVIFNFCKQRKLFLVDVEKI